MQDQSSAEPYGEQAGKGSKISDGAKKAYSRWNKVFAIKAGDTFWMKAGKIIIRIIGLLVLVALSPLILVGLIFALLAAL